MLINLSDERGLDARVEASSTRPRVQVRYVDVANEPVETRRVLRGTVDHDLATLLTQASGDIASVGDALLEGDPEVDIERFGAFLTDTARVFINADGEVCRVVHREEIVRTPDGEERERRPVQTVESNVATETALRWTGTRVAKTDAVRRFVFMRTLQLAHVNGLTYDFLFQMAKDLAEADALLLLGAGPAGKDPLIFQRRGRPYRGFLEGRVDGEAYMLLLHLSNLELKPLSP